MTQNHKETPLSGPESTPRSEMAEEGPVSLEETGLPAGVQVTIVQDEDIPCPECGAYWGNPDPALDFPNRFKTDDFCRCYNPGCPVAMYNPFTGAVEHEEETHATD